MEPDLSPLAQTTPAAWWAEFAARQAAGSVSYSDALADDVIAAVRSGETDPMLAPDAILALLKGRTEFARIWDAATNALDDIAAAFDSRLARFLLANFVIPNPTAEAILSRARRDLLMRATQAPNDPPAQAHRSFAFALAQQCHLNEFAFWEDPDETLWADVLAGNLEAMLEEKNPDTDFAFAVLGCYRPLAPWAARIEPVASAHEGFGAMRARLIDERLAETALARAMPALTEIRDHTSKEVRAHYEENPYPRWRFPFLPKTAPAPAAVRQLFPSADMASFGAVATPRILIAGCGTGFLTTSMAKLFERADITAIDLSRASLAYAKRQTDALALKVNYAQADILALDPAKLQFDIIECGGVLHHTADVMRSWRALNACLRPGGLMNVALYNTNARDWLQAPRHFARSGGYRATPKDIRRFRRDVMRATAQSGALPTGLSETLLRPDFYTLSMCRDTFFHTQEREFSLRELLGLVEEVGLRFLGLRLPSARAHSAYVQRFPDDSAVQNPHNIELLENAQKDAAGPMYTLHLQKPA